MYDALRKKKNTKSLVSIDERNDNENLTEQEDVSQDVIHILERALINTHIVEAIDTLGEVEKSIFLLHVEESMTFAEIGQIFDISPNTAKSKYRRTLLKLKTYLETMHPNTN